MLIRRITKQSILLILATLLLGQVNAADFYEVLEVGGEKYANVYVLSANASSLSIKHQRGLAQVALSELPIDLQQKYGYSADAAVARKEELASIKEVQAKQARERLQKQRQALREGKNAANGLSPIKRAFEQFGTEPRLETELDLRPRFRGHDIHVRQQRGPSCSVHAIVAALEYQYAENENTLINISERRLVEATAKTLGRSTRNDLATKAEGRGVVEEGFALEHVFQAIRGYGLEIEPRTRDAASESVIEALKDVNFSPFLVPGRNSRAGIGNIVHVLNAKIPVVVGVAWPANGRVENTSLLSKQPPASGAGHAVTIVGYKCETGKLEDVKFVFRNSWGASWGAGGYGFFTYEYLANNLWSSYVVELR